VSSFSGPGLVAGLLAVLTACQAGHANDLDEQAAQLHDRGANDGASDATPDGSECAPLPLSDAASTIAYQSDIVAHLTGVADAAPGVRLADRATPDNRRIAREYLIRLFDEIRLAPLEHAYGTGTNVYAELPSTSGAREWLVIGAHFDTVSRSPGANDNATGVALVYAVARHLAALPCRSKNVTFVLFDQEEIGLVGSRAFAKKLERERVVVRAAHTIDQMGWDKNGDRLIELERPDTGLADLYRTGAAELGGAIPTVITSTTTSDHSAFRPTFPAIGLTEGYRSGDTTPDYHRPTDTFDKVDFTYLQSTTNLVAHVLTTQLR
jgi:hypothetical protein